MSLNPDFDTFSSLVYKGNVEFNYFSISHRHRQDDIGAFSITSVKSVCSTSSSCHHYCLPPCVRCSVKSLSKWTDARIHPKHEVS